MDNEFRQLPSVDKLLSMERIGQLLESYPHALLVEISQCYLQRLRLSILAGNSCPPVDEIADAVVAQIQTLENPSLRPIINATGVILHTNLGRAPLSKEAITAMNTVANSGCNLEFDLASGKRGSRTTHIEPVLCQLTGAEAGLVVNNNAAALLLVLSALTKKREVIVSRSQAVEIGGGFRIPDVMRQSGAKLVEVGTTNCTYITDYERAITPRTAALMRVHSSNFRLIGFTHFVTLDEMVTLGSRHEIPVFDDVGSGCFLDTSAFGLDPEPTVQDSITAGASLVLFSGDKLMGGPQAGIIVGRKHLIDKLKKHPLLRAVRIDKLTLTGLAATLVQYLKGEALTKIPIWRMISAPLDDIDRRAKNWAECLPGLARVIDDETMIGGGSLPGGTLPTRVIAIGEASPKKYQSIVQAMSQQLRSREIPVIGRINDNVLLLDPRSVLPEEDEAVRQALQDLASSFKPDTNKKTK